MLLGALVSSASAATIAPLALQLHVPEGSESMGDHDSGSDDWWGQFLDGLLGNEPRKTGWMRAEAAGDPGPWRQQAILGRGRWDADALRDVVREYAQETLSDGDAVLVIDETGFLKQGKASCGVARQYTGSAGKITNCQIGVFASYGVAARSCLHRLGTLFTKGMDG